MNVVAGHDEVRTGVRLETNHRASPLLKYISLRQHPLSFHTPPPLPKIIAVLQKFTL